MNIEELLSLHSLNNDVSHKYRKYEMWLMEKIKIEAGFVTRNKVKWYGIGTFAHPYLWKEDKAETEYKESLRRLFKDMRHSVYHPRCKNLPIRI